MWKGVGEDVGEVKMLEGVGEDVGGSRCGSE